MGVANQPTDLLTRIAALQRQVDVLRHGTPLAAATITRGAVAAVDATGAHIVDLGQFTVAGVAVTGVQVRRRDGTVVFYGYGDAAGNAVWGLYDRAGNLLIGDDEVNNTGLARPWIPAEFTSMAAPTDTTTLGTFTTLGKALWRRQHAQMLLTVLANVTATTGEMRLLVASGTNTGTVIGPAATTLPAGQAWATYGPYPVPGVHGDRFEIDMQGRVASGAGTVGLRVLGAEGTQS